MEEHGDQLAVRRPPEKPVPERSNKTSTVSTKQTVHEGKYAPVCETDLN